MSKMVDQYIGIAQYPLEMVHTFDVGIDSDYQGWLRSNADRLCIRLADEGIVDSMEELDLLVSGIGGSEQ